MSELGQKTMMHKAPKTIHPQYPPDKKLGELGEQVVLASGPESASDLDLDLDLDLESENHTRRMTMGNWEVHGCN